jgi:hypothetical protein
VGCRRAAAGHACSARLQGPVANQQPLAAPPRPALPHPAPPCPTLPCPALALPCPSPSPAPAALGQPSLSLLQPPTWKSGSGSCVRKLFSGSSSRWKAKVRWPFSLTERSLYMIASGARVRMRKSLDTPGGVGRGGAGGGEASVWPASWRRQQQAPASAPAKASWAAQRQRQPGAALPVEPLEGSGTARWGSAARALPTWVPHVVYDGCQHHRQQLQQQQQQQQQQQRAAQQLAPTRPSGAGAAPGL